MKLLDQKTSSAARLSHDTNTILSTVDTLFKILGGPSNREVAPIYDRARERLIEMITRIKNEFAALESASTEYSGVVEATLTEDHPEILRFTKYFEEQTKKRKIFESFEEKNPGQDIHKARVVGVHWYQFSEFMPWFICRAASKVSTNTKRHYVIQTAYEELGMRKVDEIHPEMFFAAAKSVGVTTEDEVTFRSLGHVVPCLKFLRDTIESYESDEEVMGILLGLEIPAQENIETIFKSLSHSPYIEKKLSQNKFFVLHRQIEVEHVRLTVSNFLRFCDTEEKKAKFLIGFEHGLDFWSDFWSKTSDTIHFIKSEMK